MFMKKREETARFPLAPADVIVTIQKKELSDTVIILEFFLHGPVFALFWYDFR